MFKQTGLESLSKTALQPMTASPWAVFRVVLGVTLFCWAHQYLQLDRWRILFLQPELYFKYAGFNWVNIWPNDGIWWHLQIMRLSALAFAIGLATRLNAAFLSLSVAYVLLVDRQHYNNHDYLLACTAMLCVFLPSNRCCSADRWIRGHWKQNDKIPPPIPQWQWWLVRFQLALPYVFGAIAKLDIDWLSGRPTMLWVQARTGLPLMGSLMSLPYMNLLVAWGGIIFDAAIVPALYFRRTRPFAIVAALGFHLTNATIFTIGVFPWFMLATLFVFIPTKTIERLFNRIAQSLWGRNAGSDLLTATKRFTNDAILREPSSTEQPIRWHRMGTVLAGTYVFVQLLLPLRPWVLPGQPSWNERGQRFAWRMMLRHKECLTWFKIETDDDYLFVPASHIMTPNQLTHGQHDPELIRQSANHLQSMASRIGASQTRVYALHLVSLNGRRPAYLVDPDIDLTKVRRGWFKDDWVNQTPGQTMQSPWRKPKDEWWNEIQIPERFKLLTRYSPDEATTMFQSLMNRFDPQTSKLSAIVDDD
ncbi:HTTM domain-containing protein [Stieleria sp. JC731]|uniref:HTTM domain-containing protein n=1 Tax=Pirellulaceae TaxID=2691357 RepID=UPI001E607DC2|nr:HTTM domain-containing protein [Stieleria sp. JC731]MCC9603175.1 HTTM domain-containing protein [Stieleria sp. JC731]